jgi:transketolase
VNGHDFNMLIDAIETATSDHEHHYVIIAQTAMGHGVSFMENSEDYHGKAPTCDECSQALRELGIEDDVDHLLAIRKDRVVEPFDRVPIPNPTVKTGSPRLYEDTLHPRAAFGKALEDIAVLNSEGRLAVFDCDLAGSVKVKGFAKQHPACFFECGVSEHNTATMAGALSINGVVSVWADFGVFSLDEVYNQMRLNDINETHVKIIATHLGYNVGPDGKTHQCIDYIGLLQNLHDVKFVIPADPNQTDHITRYILKQPGCYVMGLTRSKLPVIRREDGSIVYNERYQYAYGAIDLIRDGTDGVVFTYGPMTHEAIKAWDRLKAQGVTIRIYNVCSPLHMDKEIILEAAETGCVITYEDHAIQSGLGSIVADIIAESRIATKFKKVGIKQYGGSAPAGALYRKAGIDMESLVTIIKELIQSS